jgi:hypothetical protein
VDDHTFIGYWRDVASLIFDLVTAKDGIRYSFIESTSEVLGLHVIWSRLGSDVYLRFDQITYGYYWVDRFEQTLGRDVRARTSPASSPWVPAGPEHDLGPEGNLKGVAARYIMACMYSARMTLPGLLQPCSALSKRLHSWHNDEDRRLVTLYAGWKNMLNEGFGFEMHVNTRDCFEHTLEHETCVDSSHGDDAFTKCSTSGWTSSIVGTHGTNACLDFGLKTQAKAHTSSGASEIEGIADGTGWTTSSEWDDAQRVEAHQYFMQHTGDIAAAEFVSRRSAIPLYEFCESAGLDTRRRALRVDASVAIVCTMRGFSKVYIYLRKAHGISLAALKGYVDDLGLELEKIDSAVNPSDLFTKALLWAVAYKHLRRIGAGTSAEGYLDRIAAFYAAAA